MGAFDPIAHHARADPHRPGSRLADVILGGQDGLVNVLGVILGVAGRPWKSGAELALIGILSALAGYAVGAAFHASP